LRDFLGEVAIIIGHIRFTSPDWRAVTRIIHVKKMPRRCFVPVDADRWILKLAPARPARVGEIAPAVVELSQSIVEVHPDNPGARLSGAAAEHALPIDIGLACARA